MPPEGYFPFVDAWIAAHPDALVFVATDERAYHERISARYGTWRGGQVGVGGGGEGVGGGGEEGRGVDGDWASSGSKRRGAAPTETVGRVVSAGRGYVSRNVIADVASLGGGHARGVDVLIDALLLSKCDFLLKASSAVAEFAIWANLDLHQRHIDLQWEDRLRSQRPLPAWADGVMKDDAQAFCEGLARGCRLDARRWPSAGARAHLLQSSQACSRCQPKLDATSEAAASLAAPMDGAGGARGDSGTCASLAGERRRGLTQAECVAYARVRGLEFIGSQSERSEFAGCVTWNRRTVEFNDHSAGTGCNVRSKGGECLCTPVVG